jgi:hypothetical protein
MSKFKTTEYQGTFFVTQKSPYGEREYDIIGHGKTERESLLMALEKVSLCHEKLSKEVVNFVKVLSHNDNESLDRKEELFWVSSCSFSDKDISFNSFYLGEDEKDFYPISDEMMIINEGGAS